MKRHLFIFTIVTLCSIGWPVQAATLYQYMSMATLSQYMSMDGLSDLALTDNHLEVSTRRRGVSMNYWPFRESLQERQSRQLAQQVARLGDVHDPLMLALESFLDWRPFRDSFHITWGMLKDNGLQEYDASDDERSFLYHGIWERTDMLYIAGQSDTNDILPYVGVGWTQIQNLPKPVHFSLHVGIVYQKQSRLPFVLRGQQVQQSWYLYESQQQAKKATRGLSHELYPVLSMGMKIAF